MTLPTHSWVAACARGGPPRLAGLASSSAGRVPSVVDTQVRVALQSGSTYCTNRDPETDYHDDLVIGDCVSVLMRGEVGHANVIPSEFSPTETAQFSAVTDTCRSFQLGACRR